MSNYTIEIDGCGTVLGPYDATSPDDALDAMSIGCGYYNFRAYVRDNCTELAAWRIYFMDGAAKHLRATLVDGVLFDA